MNCDSILAQPLGSTTLIGYKEAVGMGPPTGIVLYTVRISQQILHV